MSSATAMSATRPPVRRRRGAISGETCREEDVTTTERKVVPKDPATRVSLQKAIKDNVLMAHLDRDDLNDIFDAMFPVKGKVRGDVIIQQGEQGDNFYIIENGMVEVLVDGKSVSTIKERGSFGELALIYGTPRAATIRVISDKATFWGIDRLTYRRILMGNTIKKRQMYLEFLKKVPILAGLDEWQMLTVADSLFQVEFESGETIIREGESGDTFYIIIEGEANVVRRDQGKVNLLGPSDYFGEVALLMGGIRRATVTAKTLLRCAGMDRDRFERVIGPCVDMLTEGMKAYGLQ